MTHFNWSNIWIESCIVFLLHTKKAINKLSPFKTFRYWSKWVHQRMTKIHVMVYKAYVQKNSFMHVDVNVWNQISASYALLAENITTIRETLCSWVCVFAFCLNLLHQLVMLGPEQPYHKKHSPQKVGQQLAKDCGTNYYGAKYRSVTAGQISMIHVFLPVLAIITLKFRIVSNTTNLSHLNCLFS